MTDEGELAAARRRRRIRVSGDAPQRRGTLFHHLFVSRFSIGAKLIVAAGMMMLPLLAFGALFVLGQFRDVRSAELQLRGMALYRPLSNILHSMAVHAELEPLVIRNEISDRPRVEGLLQSALEQVAILQALDQAQGNARTHEKVAELRKQLLALKEHPPQTAGQSLVRNVALLELTRSLGVQIGSDWGLHRDPDIAVARLSELAFLDTHDLLRTWSELRARLAISHTQGGSRDDDNRLRIAELAAIATNRVIFERSKFTAATESPTGRRRIVGDIATILSSW
jgi:hypothetical protein